MGATHEMRENFRRYRYNHPEYRLLFLLFDIVMVLVNFALFAGFLLLCWYITNRSPLTTVPVAGSGNGAVVTAIAEPENVAMELSEDRIALLKSIAGQNAGQIAIEDANQENLAPIGTNQDDLRQIGLLGSASDLPANAGTVVQLEAAKSANVSNAEDLANVSDELASEWVYAESLPLPQQSTESDIEGTDWVLEQVPNNFTVQLALTVNRPFLVDFARQLPTELVAAIYPEQRNDKGNVQYSLSVGNFPAKVNAEAYLSEMTDNDKRYGAHLRTFKEIQINASKFE